MYAGETFSIDASGTRWVARGFAVMLIAVVALAVSGIPARADTLMPTIGAPAAMFDIDRAEQAPALFTPSTRTFVVPSDRLEWNAGLGNAGLMQFEYNMDPNGQSLIVLEHNAGLGNAGLMQFEHNTAPDDRPLFVLEHNAGLGNAGLMQFEYNAD